MPPPKTGDLSDEVQGYKDALDLDPSDLADLDESTPKDQQIALRIMFGLFALMDHASGKKPKQTQ